MKINHCLIVLVLCYALASCKKIDFFYHIPTFSKLYGNSYNDAAYCIIAASYGGYVFAGRSNIGGLEDKVDGSNIKKPGGWIVKLDKQGDIMWQNHVGKGAPDMFSSIITTPDGGYIAAGRTFKTIPTPYDATSDVWIVKVDKDGNKLWEKVYGGSDEDWANSIIRASDGGYILVGYTRSSDGDLSGKHENGDAWVFKIDEAGKMLWQKSYGGSGLDQASEIVAASNGQYVVAGYSSSNDGDVSGNHGIIDYWVFKIDYNGKLLWQKMYGGSDTDWATSITVSHNGGFVLTGYTSSNDGDVNGNHGYDDIWVIDLDSNGNLVWQRALGGSSYDYAFSIIMDPLDGYAISGETFSTDGDLPEPPIGGGDAWVVVLDWNGSIKWQKLFGGTDSDNPSAVIPIIGGYAVAGHSYSNDGDVSGNHGESDAWVFTIKHP